MSQQDWGNSATIATSGRGLYGVRADVTLPSKFAASGIDSRNYFDAYLGVFTNDPKNSFIEAGIGYYGELHRDKKTQKIGPSYFPKHWSTLLNPLGGALLHNNAQGQRNQLYTGPNVVHLELRADGANKGVFLVNTTAFRGEPSFTYGFGGTGIESRTFDGGLNIKACIGFNDADHTIHFADMAIAITEVLARGKDGKLAWGPPVGFASVHGLHGATVRTAGSSLTVSYNPPRK